jgi:hypothetical protein
MRKAILILFLLCVPAQSGCAVMKWLLEAWSDPEMDAMEAQIEQDKYEAELTRQYGRAR